MRLPPAAARLALVVVMLGTFVTANDDTAEAFAPVVDPAAGDAIALEAARPLLDRLAGLCGGAVALDVPGVDLCTHGPDTAPAARRSSRAGSAVPTRALTCVGDGREGQRVEVLYLHAIGTPAAGSQGVAQLRRWVGQVEWTVAASAERLGGVRSVRWVHDGDCRAVVRSVALSASALSTIDGTIAALREAGFRRTDRTYLLFADSTRYCGIATSPRDDRAGEQNRADAVAGYARVDRPCWDAGDEGYHSLAAHELLHTLGAVQASAPHGTKGAHCTDEHDLLCYADARGVSTRTVCVDDDATTRGAGDANDRLLDCRGDDYFHPAPARGSYLATHWNTADSARLFDPTARQDGPVDSVVDAAVGLLFGD